jgi:hypothetical protein
MVEHRLPKPVVAGSIPVSRSIASRSCPTKGIVSFSIGHGRSGRMSVAALPTLQGFQFLQGAWPV